MQKISIFIEVFVIIYNVPLLKGTGCETSTWSMKSVF